MKHWIILLHFGLALNALGAETVTLQSLLDEMCDRDRIALDVTLETASAYIDVLRAKTQERIARENLRLTHENLERARIRTQVGVASLAEVYRWEAQLAADRQTVIFANGGFDLFHVGHIRYLRGAAAEGDVLLVALNSDASIRRNKGPGRPHVPLAERMEIVATTHASRRDVALIANHPPTPGEE